MCSPRRGFEESGSEDVIWIMDSNSLVPRSSISILTAESCGRNRVGRRQHVRSRRRSVWGAAQEAQHPGAQQPLTEGVAAAGPTFAVGAAAGALVGPWVATTSAFGGWVDAQQPGKQTQSAADVGVERDRSTDNGISSMSSPFRIRRQAHHAGLLRASGRREKASEDAENLVEKTGAAPAAES